MNKLLLIFLASIMSVTNLAAQDGHDGHAHSNSNEGEVHDLGNISIAGTTFRVISYGEITPGSEAVIGIEVEQGKAPSQLRAWIGVRNGRGSVKYLLYGDSHGHFHGHLEVPSKLPHGSEVWLDVTTEAGRQLGAASIPE
ncbi:MAG: hypothetical protein AB2689_24630 [Candidatus Thiodiazotropha taylori]